MGKSLMFLAALTHAFACESVYAPPCEVWGLNERVFLGTALETSAEFGPTRFHVDEAFKGIPPDLIELEVGSGPCGSGYRTGERYLVLASHSVPNGPGYSLGEHIDDASRSIALIRAVVRGEHRFIIQGQVAANVQDSMVTFEIDYETTGGLQGVEITATSSEDGARFTGVTGYDGSYSISVPKAGVYKITAKLAQHATKDAAYELEVAPDSCKELNFGMWTASHLTGHLTDADGKPASGITVEVQPVSEDRSSPEKVKTDDTGRFEFKNIPVGEYVVGVNTTGLNSKLPYAPTYFPGVPRKTAAGVVRVSGAQTINGLDFQIGERKPTRQIIVSVEWADGRPVTNASVSCLSTYSEPAALQIDGVFRYVDLKGDATCEVLADQNYTVEVDRLSWEHSDRPVQPIATRPKIMALAGTFTVRLRFVIDLVNDISASEKPQNMAEYNDREF